MSIPDIGDMTMRKTTAKTTTKTTKATNRVRETAPRYARKTKAPAPATAEGDWSSAFAAAKEAVVTDVTRPIGTSRTKQIGVAAALVGAGFGIASLLR